MSETYTWTPPRADGTYWGYLYNHDTSELSRAFGIASVYSDDEGAYRVDLSWQFNDLVPPTAYILRKKFPTLQAAQRAVERKIPGLVAVLKIQGRW